MHTVGFFLTEGFQLLDFSGPAAAFENTREFLPAPAYEFVPLSWHGNIVRNSLGMTQLTRRVGTVAIDTLMVIGGDPRLPLETKAVARLAQAAANCQRVASVCVGAFALAATGLLDGRRATTHWRYAAQLQREYPQVRVEADRIFCRDGHVWTSAGITAGIDLTLALIEQDHGFILCQSVARELVVYPRRLGGQSQFATLGDPSSTDERIAAALQYARERLAKPLTVAQLARSAGLSPRQFGRAFYEATGTTPARAVERLRADLARGRLETGTESVGRIAVTVGFGDEERMRRAFLRIYGHSPQSVRRVARRVLR